MKLKKCEYCGTEFDAALSQCPLCGKAVQPGAAEPQPVMPAAYKPAGGRGGKFSKKKGGHFAADPKKEKEAKSAENPYKIPKWMMVTICVILGLAVLMGAAFALYQLSWFPKFLSPSEPVSMQEQEAEVQPEQPAQEEPAPAAAEEEETPAGEISAEEAPEAAEETPAEEPAGEAAPAEPDADEAESSAEEENTEEAESSAEEESTEEAEKADDSAGGLPACEEELLDQLPTEDADALDEAEALELPADEPAEVSEESAETEEAAPAADAPAPAKSAAPAASPRPASLTAEVDLTVCGELLSRTAATLPALVRFAAMHTDDAALLDPVADGGLRALSACAALPNVDDLSGLGVIAAAHALGHAGRQRYNIFGCAAQLHPGNIGAAVNTKARVHKNALHPFGNGFFRAGRHAAGGHLPRYLLRVGGTRKRRYRISRQLLRQDLRHPQTAFRLHALGHCHQHCSRR